MIKQFIRKNRGTIGLVVGILAGGTVAIATITYGLSKDLAVSLGE